jgi:hypothetical protein
MSGNQTLSGALCALHCSQRNRFAFALDRFTLTSFPLGQTELNG